MAIAVLLAGLPLILAWRLRSKQSATGFLAASFAAGLVSQQFLVFTVPTALYFYFLAALLVASVVKEEVSVAEKASPLFAQVGRVAISLVLLVFAGQLTLADLGLEQTRGYVKKWNVLETIRSYSWVRRVQPWGMNADLWFAEAMDVLSKTAPDIPGRIVALQFVRTASRRAAEHSDERPNAYCGLDVAHAVYGNYKGAEMALRSAIEMAPQWYKPHWILAEVLDQRGLADQALREAELAVWLNGGKNLEVRERLENMTAR